MSERPRGPGTTELDRERLRADAEAARDQRDAERDKAVLDALSKQIAGLQLTNRMLIAGYLVVFVALGGVSVSGHIPGLGDVAIMQPGEQVVGGRGADNAEVDTEQPTPEVER